jgi:hypothetical protein
MLRKKMKGEKEGEYLVWLELWVIQVLTALFCPRPFSVVCSEVLQADHQHLHLRFQPMVKEAVEVVEEVEVEVEHHQMMARLLEVEVEEEKTKDC